MNNHSFDSARGALNLRARLLVGASAMIMSATPTLMQPAFAQSSAGVEDIIVTAQRREEQAQNVPIAITAIGATQLERQGVTNVIELQSAVPGLNYTRAVGTYGLPFIRGIGTTSQGGGIENPVATYIDGVYIFSTAGAVQSLRDVDQVAVLKGPQGTLFGRNAVGGLIQVTTRKPTEVPTFEGQASIGNLQTNSEQVYIAGPLVEGLSASLSLMNDQQKEGWGKNLFTGQDINTHETVAGRAKILWEPTDSTSIMLSADTSHNIAAAPANRFVLTNALGQTQAGGDFDINLNVQPRSDVVSIGYTLNGRQDFGPVQFVSITGLRNDKIHTRFDADGSTEVLQELEGWNKNHAFSQEFQLLSDYDSRLSWVAGVYYMDAGNKAWASNTSRRLPAVAVPPATYLAMPISQTWNDTKQTIKSWAGYAQATFKIDDATNITAGARYTKDERSINTIAYTRAGYPNGPINQNASTAAAPNPSSNTVEFKDPSWRLSIDHRFSDSLMVYASYNRGFRSGSFVNATSTSYLDPEKLDAYEVGFKSDLLDRHLRFNASAYYYIDHDRKSTQIVLGQQTAFSATEATLYGFDADMTWLVTENFTLTAGVAGVHTEYTDYSAAPITTVASPLGYGGRTLTVGSVTGNQLEATPPWTVTLAPSYVVDTEIGELRASANYYYNDGWFAAPDNRIRQQSYSTVAANLTWTPAFAQNINVQLWGRNLTDTAYAEQFSETTQSDNYQVGAGRAYGVTLGVRF
jgi:iron complex outermembrane receptor protein